MRDREVVERVKDATDLVALVGQVVKLRKQGAAWVGLCPFHGERSPSFQVVPDRQFWHCFGCGKHGDALSWLMEREGLTFPEALEQLANAAGVELPKKRERPSAEVDAEGRMRGALEAAQAFYRRQLERSGKGQAYLRERGMEGAFLEEAGFGVAPDGWDGLIQHFRQVGLSLESAEQAGLLSRSERGSMLDFLRDRLTIPIHDVRGRLVAFGGRAFGDAKPKYLNTRETPLFNKSETLFGLHRAKAHLRDGALVVEGYFDVLQLHQQGVMQAVAPLGTALTESHLRVLARYTKRLVLCFDGDAAGLRAMEKSLRLALPLGFEAQLLLLPHGEDPDTWCLRLGAEAFRDLIRLAPDWATFVYQKACENKNLLRASDRLQAFQELVDFLPFLPRSNKTRELFSGFAHQLQVPLSELDRAIQSRKQPDTTAASTIDDISTNLPQSIDIHKHIRQLILFYREGLHNSVTEVPPAWWEALPGAPVLQALIDSERDDSNLPNEALAHIRRIEAGVLLRDKTATQSSEAYFLQIEGDYVARELQATNRQLMDPRAISDPDLKRRLEIRAADLIGRQKELNKLTRQARTPRPT